MQIGQMQQCAQHVQHQVPDGRQHVTCLLDNIECSDAPLQAAMAQARAAITPGGPRVNFEQAVAKKCSARGTKRKADASESSANVSGTENKPSVGKTGIEFWFYAKKIARN